MSLVQPRGDCGSVVAFWYPFDGGLCCLATSSEGAMVLRKIAHVAGLCNGWPLRVGKIDERRL